MIVLLGASGYFGQAFARELQRRVTPFLGVSRTGSDYTRFDVLLDLLKKTKATFLINSAGFTGKPNVDACESERAETLLGNVLLPQTIAHACEVAGVPWGHLSSGCIYAGAKVVDGNASRTVTDFTEIRRLADERSASLHGFAETDEPNFTLRHPPCSFYSGSKALAEEAIADIGEIYLWRPRIPFDEYNHPRNYLTKLQTYPKAYESVNSISHRGDCVRACLDLWLKRAPFGIYNLTNPGSVTTQQVIAAITRVLKPNRKFEYWKDDDDFYRHAAKAPRSNCILDVSKLLATGVRMRPVEEALEDALSHY